MTPTPEEVAGRLEAQADALSEQMANNAHERRAAEDAGGFDNHALASQLADENAALIDRESHLRQAASLIRTLEAKLSREERAHEQTVDERDIAQATAERLAGLIAQITGADIGEHSAGLGCPGNDPFLNAIDAAEAHLRNAATLEADRRSLAERVEKLEGALADVLPYAERGAYLSEKCAFEYGDGYTQPYELTISWEWQQSKPYTGGWVSLRSDTEAWVSELRESEADVAVVRARSALERP